MRGIRGKGQVRGQVRELTIHIELAKIPWRTGRKVGRTIYAQLGAEPTDHDPLIGLMDTAALARAAVDAHNRMLSD